MNHFVFSFLSGYISQKKAKIYEQMVEVCFYI
jgi:hypothetical protein